MIKPSEVVLGPDVPLVGTLGKAEFEHAAAMLVRACQVLGDKWQPVDPDEGIEVFRKDVEAKTAPWVHLNTNPFFQPDFRGLVEAGFANWTGPNKLSIELNEKAITAFYKWVKHGS